MTPTTIDNPLKDNLLMPVIGAGFCGGIVAFGSRGDIEWTAYFAGLGAIEVC